MNPSVNIVRAHLFLWFAASGLLCGQQPRVYTAADYAQAEKFMSYNAAPLAYKGVVSPHWMGDGRLWYRAVDEAGTNYRLVDPAKKTNVAAFDETKLAAALNAASNRIKADPSRLRLNELSFTDSDRKLHVTSNTFSFDCTLAVDYKCAAAPDKSPAKPVPLNISPDKTKGAFLRDWNLWVRDIATGTETQLTTDGIKDYGYATDNAGWKQSDAAILLWSPDSKKIATFQQDQRKDGEMYLVPVTNGHPELKAWKYPLVGDENVTMIERVIIGLDSKKITRFKMPPDQHRGSVCDDVACKGNTWEDVEWSPDATQLAFLSTARDHKREELRVADASTGEVRHVMAETANKFLETGDGMVNWHALFATDEVIWFSDRENWGQLYLYDLRNGRIKNQITHGDGNVTQVLHVDEKARVIYFLGVGKETGRDPYYVHLYSVHFDGTEQKLLTPEDANHTVAFSPDFAYFTDIASTPTTPATTVVRSSSGQLAMEVAKQDISKLVASGWVPPVPFTVKARDGKTDLYGFLFRPTHFDASKRYPIVNHIYPGPQTGSCGTRSFAATRGDSQALAELGFIVVCIDGMGTNLRSKSFHEAYYGRLGDNTLPDQVLGMKQLGTKYPWIDLDRAGIYGHSGGGNATATAMFNYPDFFKVGISESGNHDQRDYEDDWAEKWAGLLVKKADSSSNYDSQANQNIAKNLKGHLLLAHGTMDDNVPPNNTLLVVEALIKANKDFDLLMIPNVAHGYAAASQYMARRRWDYFVKYLSGDTPPHEYEIKPYAEAMAATTAGPSDDNDDALE